MEKNSSSSATSVNPLSEQDVACPMCGEKTRQKRPKPRLYVEQDLEVDLRPRRYLWTVKGDVTPHPPLYYMWRCQKCNFAASTVSFDEPLKNASISVQAYKAKVESARRSNPSVDKVIKELASSIESGEIDHFHAIKTHLLAIFHLQIVDEIVERDSLELAKYCLRLGWLYRELVENPALKTECGSKIDALQATLKLQWPEVPLSEEAALRSAIHFYRTALEKSPVVDGLTIEIELELIVSRIAMRLGDMAIARRYLDVAKAQIKKQDEDIKKNPDRYPDKAKARAEITKLTNVVAKVQNILSDFRDKWEGEQIEKARAAVTGHEGKSPEELKTLLSEKGFDNKIIAQVVKAPPEKKGFLGGLFGS